MYVIQCLSFAQSKGTTKFAPILDYFLLARPFDVVGNNLYRFSYSYQGSLYVLISYDHFSRFVILIPLFIKSVPTVAYALVPN